MWAWVLGEHSEQGFVNALVGGLVGTVDMEALCGTALSDGIGAKAAQVCGFWPPLSACACVEQGSVDALVAGLVGSVGMEALCGAALSDGIGAKAAQVCGVWSPDFVCARGKERCLCLCVCLSLSLCVCVCMYVCAEEGHRERARGMPAPSC